MTPAERTLFLALAQAFTYDMWQRYPTGSYGAELADRVQKAGNTLDDEAVAQSILLDGREYKFAHTPKASDGPTYLRIDALPKGVTYIELKLAAEKAGFTLVDGRLADVSIERHSEPETEQKKEPTNE